MRLSEFFEDVTPAAGFQAGPRSLCRADHEGAVLLTLSCHSPGVTALILVLTLSRVLGHLLDGLLNVLLLLARLRIPAHMDPFWHAPLDTCTASQQEQAEATGPDRLSDEAEAVFTLGPLLAKATCFFKHQKFASSLLL